MRWPTCAALAVLAAGCAPDRSAPEVAEFPLAAAPERCLQSCDGRRVALFDATGAVVAVLDLEARQLASPLDGEPALRFDVELRGMPDLPDDFGERAAPATWPSETERCVLYPARPEVDRFVRELYELDSVHLFQPGFGVCSMRRSGDALLMQSGTGGDVLAHFDGVRGARELPATTSAAAIIAYDAERSVLRLTIAAR